MTTLIATPTTEKLNKLWRECIRLMFGGKCKVCGQPGTDAHHLIKRNTNGLKYKWDTCNGVYLCRTHHDRFENDVNGLLPYLHYLQVDWYHIAKDNKRFEYLDKSEIEAALKAKLKELSDERS